MKNRQNPHHIPPDNAGTSREEYDERDRRLSLLVEDLFTFIEEMDQSAGKDGEKQDLVEF